jgi:hypothetical protein
MRAATLRSMRHVFLVVGAACLGSAIFACEDLGGLRGGEDDGGASEGGAADATADSRSPEPDDAAAEASPDGGDAGACDLAPVENGIVAYFPFDEGTGVLARDCGPSGLAAAISGTKTWGAGRRNGALVFDGTSTCVTVENDPAGTFTKPFTVAAWVNVVAFPSSSTATIIIGRTVDSNEDGFRLAADQGSIFNMKVGVPGLDGGYFRIASGLQPTNAWRHVLAVYEPSAKGVLYVDGSAVDTDTTDVPVMTIDNAAMLRIGCGSVGNFFSGSIDDVRIYDRALSAVEIALLSSP